MSKQSFSGERLSQTLSSRAYKSISVSKKKSDLTLFEASSKLMDGKYEIEDFHSYNISQKPVYCTKTQADEAVLSKLDENIRKIYKVKQKDRHAAIKQLKLLLSEDIPKYIYKFDIEDFYSNVDLDELYQKFEQDGILNSESFVVLNLFKEKIASMDIVGVPRGIGLSASLAELFSREFDESMKSIDGVYYYVRYVDDILIISNRRLDINSEIKPFLHNSLNFNNKKTKVCRVYSCFCESCKCSKSPCKCWSKCICKPCGCQTRKCKNPGDCEVKVNSFDFLGYSFSFPQLAKSTNGELKVDISDSKFRKTKNRLYLSFKEYHKKGDFKKLKDRVSFLTGNYYISDRKSKVDAIKSGVYYSYMCINNMENYNSLDKLLMKLIFKKYSKVIKLSEDQKKALMKYSFSKGYKNKYTFSFNAAQINKIKKGWNNG